MKKIALAFATAGVLLSLSIQSAAVPTEMQQDLVMAKFSGACGVLNQMVQFQAATKMAGGTEFLSRFLATEAARLGTTQAEYMERCSSAIEYYNAIFEAIGKQSAP